MTTAYGLIVMIPHPRCNAFDRVQSAAAVGPGSAMTDFSTLKEWLAESDGKLIVLSNRAAVRIVRDGTVEHVEPTVGGVGTSFLRLLEHTGGSWIAWSGIRGASHRMPVPPGNPRFTAIMVGLSEREIGSYYYGTCNRGLWPLMHFMPLNCHFDATEWNCYRRVNQIFAQAALEEATDRDLLWVQDFHLALTPAIMRAARRLRIGLFWHVPFPPPEVLRVLPWRQELLAGMLGADVIGFQSPAFVGHFLDCCESVGGVSVDRARGRVSNGSRVVRVGAFPIGIPFDYFAELGASPRVKARVHRIRHSLHSQRIVLAVDRLDYTKGLVERLEGFERFLEAAPEYRGKVTFIQVAVPSRTRVDAYIQLKRDVDETVGRIVGRFSTDRWIPVRYLYTQLSTEELIAYYQAADIALVTPLRDGMNLVAKEYVASRPNEDGVLILSELAGAAGELSEALIVNPYDAEQIAFNLIRALEMETAERTSRMRALRRRVRENDLEHWSTTFLGALSGERAVPFCDATGAN